MAGPRRVAGARSGRVRCGIALVRPGCTEGWAAATPIRWSLLFSRSTDDGHTFSRPRVISAPGDQHPDFAVVVPGPRRALSVVYGASTIRVTTSHDGGRVFTAPVTVPGAFTTQGTQPYEASSIGAAADPRTGTLYVTFAEQTGHPARLRVVITHASTGGRWATPTEVDPEPAAPAAANSSLLSP